MNRRGFLQCLGAFAAAAFIPSYYEKIARAPAWAKEVVLYRTSAPLAAGSYTFTAFSGEYGMYVGGVKATGGETLFEIPKESYPMERPRLILGGIVVSYDHAMEWGDLTDPENVDRLQRGESVDKA